MFCSKCGAALSPGAAFCQTCGTPAGAISPHSGAGAITYAIGVVYAGFWLRFVAWLVDGVILGLGTGIVSIPLFFMMGGAAIIQEFIRHPQNPPQPEQIWALGSLGVTLIAFATIVQWLYFAYLESGAKQATWGKQLLGLYVTDLSGNSISFGRASGRFFAKIITKLIPLWIGFIMAGFTERRQALHDMIASTLVLRR